MTTKTTAGITPGMTVNEIIEAAPETVSVFQAWNVDACCGGALPLEIVAERHGFDLAKLLEDLRSA